MMLSLMPRTERHETDHIEVLSDGTAASRRWGRTLGVLVILLHLLYDIHMRLPFP